LSNFLPSRESEANPQDSGREQNLVPGVVGMSCQDGQGAVDLLGEYDPGELMRQGNST
jgi:hypothetical protein